MIDLWHDEVCDMCPARGNFEFCEHMRENEECPLYGEEEEAEQETPPALLDYLETEDVE